VGWYALASHCILHLAPLRIILSISLILLHCFKSHTFTDDCRLRLSLT
jgi:hypothetical protein